VKEQNLFDQRTGGSEMIAVPPTHWGEVCTGGKWECKSKVVWGKWT